MQNSLNEGGFTLPGEAGYEALSLELAQKWGADVIRDSDGTQLSPELLNAGYGIYSTICIIREHNEWIKQNTDAQQQCFLCTEQQTATAKKLEIDPMAGFFSEQFAVNDTANALARWQVYDRTQNRELKQNEWEYNPQSQSVIINAVPFHSYTVSFLAWRKWEEISMYNHVTNSWNKEHLMQLDPVYPKVREYLLNWLENWCKEHPHTTVVRFTSLFYNFAWIWGQSKRLPHIFTDWASYDFTVSTLMLEGFEKEYGYSLTAEDFVRGGSYNATHCVPSRQKLDWMDYVGRFVRGFTKQLTDIVHKYGKKAYVFYDDSWVGLEPYNGHFAEMGFDGLIKCVFSGFEARLCAGVDVPVHELRFHPYLFPVGLGGAPTFSNGGSPEKDAVKYWLNVRRALLRAKIERTGLGGYLHLVQDKPEFVDCMTEIMGEFRQITALHENGAPASLPLRVAVLTSWGRLRSWTLSGHFHETDNHVLIHIIEALSGMPVDVEFISFADVENSALQGFDVIINAGRAGDAWSGGAAWQSPNLIEKINKWVYEGGVFLGVNEPAAAAQGASVCLPQVLGVDMNTIDRACHAKLAFEEEKLPKQLELLKQISLPEKANLYLNSQNAKVYAAKNGQLQLTANSFGKGKGVYLSGFETSFAANRFLLDLMLWAAEKSTEGISNNPYVECAIFEQAGKIAFINNSEQKQSAAVDWNGKTYTAEINKFGFMQVSI